MITAIAKQAVAFRVIADHIRAISFTIADGQLPSNTGAGYVIRRILRRAVRYYYSYLDYKQPLLNQLVPVLAKQFENVFPELQKHGPWIRTSARVPLDHAQVVDDVAAADDQHAFVAQRRERAADLVVVRAGRCRRWRAARPARRPPGRHARSTDHVP